MVVLDDVAVVTVDVTLPGEPFLNVAESLQEAAPRLIVAGYCDGAPGHLPTSDACPEGGYEVEDACMYYSMAAPFKRGAAEELVRLGTSLVRGTLTQPVPHDQDRA